MNIHRLTPTGRASKPKRFLFTSMASRSFDPKSGEVMQVTLYTDAGERVSFSADEIRALTKYLTPRGA